MSDPANFVAASPRHALPFLFAGQAQKEFTFNETVARIDILLHPAVAGELTLPPSDMEPGDCYLVATGGEGSFREKDGSLALWDGQQWTFCQAREGMILRDNATGTLLVHDGAWQRLTAPVAPSGGSIIDVEARAAIEELVGKLTAFGIFS